MYSLSESLPHIFFFSGTRQNSMHSSLQPWTSSWSKRDDPITLGCEETRQLCFERRPRCFLRSNGARLGNDRRGEAQRGKTSGSGQVRQALEQQKKTTIGTNKLFSLSQSRRRGESVSNAPQQAHLKNRHVRDTESVGNSSRRKKGKETPELENVPLLRFGSPILTTLTSLPHTKLCRCAHTTRQLSLHRAC